MKIAQKLIAFLPFAFLGIQIANAQKPTLNSFSPLSGPVGSTVIISGSNFNATPANNVVYFGTTKATVDASSTTSTLKVTVPAGASFAPITVTNKAVGLSSKSLLTFTPSYNPSKTTIGNSDFTGPTVTSFGNPNPYTLGVTAGDMDGDGKTDLVFASRFANAISVLRNTTVAAGTITFAASQDFSPTYQEPYVVGLVDLDGDGMLDMVTPSGNLNGTGISLFRNTSTPGNLSMDAPVSFAANSSSSIATGDLDGDGKIDLVTTDGTRLAIYRNTSTGIGNVSLASPFYTDNASLNAYVGCKASILDVNGDGKLDIVSGNGSNAVIFINASSGIGDINFPAVGTPIATASGNNVAVTAIADFNADGKMDFATISSFNLANTSVSIFTNTSTLNSVSFTRVDYLSTDNADMTIADFNGDGKPDIALTTLTYNTHNLATSVYQNTSVNGVTSFAAKKDFGQDNAFAPYNGTSADLDNDGKPEIITSNTNSYAIFRNTPTSTANVSLSNLSITAGSLSPVFSASTSGYTVNVSNATTTTTVTPTVADATSTVAVRINNGAYTAITSGNPSSALALSVGSNPIDVTVTSQDGTTKQTYTILVTRQDNSLPVKLKSFTAKADGNRSKLEWITSSEKDNSSFEIERSNDGNSFNLLTTIKGGGNTSIEHKYLTYDQSPLSGVNYYRLAQIDYDGKKTILETKAVSFNLSTMSITTYPNPSSGTINLSFKNIADSQLSLRLFDYSGKLIHQEKITLSSTTGSHKLTLKTVPPPGQYLLQVKGASFEESTKVSIL